MSTLLNTAFRGPSLMHALNLSGAETVVADAALVPHIAEVADQLVHVSPAHRDRRPRLPGVTGMEVLDHASPLHRRDDVHPIGPLRHRPGDGAVHLRHDRAVERMCAVASLRRSPGAADDREPRLRSNDVLYCPFPMFHIDATVMTIVPAMLLGHHRCHRREVLGVGVLGRGSQCRCDRVRLHGRDLDDAAQATAACRRWRQSRQARMGCAGA